MKKEEFICHNTEGKMAKELFDFFDNYGDNGIKINVDSE